MFMICHSPYKTLLSYRAQKMNTSCITCSNHSNSGICQDKFCIKLISKIQESEIDNLLHVDLSKALISSELKDENLVCLKDVRKVSLDAFKRS